MTLNRKASAKARFVRVGKVESLTAGPVTDLSEDHGFKTDKTVEPKALAALK